MLEVIIAGFVGSISALRFTSNGKAVCNLSLAESKRDGSTVWHRVVCWGKQAEAVVAHLTKGAYVVVASDTYVPKTYKAKDGSVKCSVEFWASRVSFGPKAKKDNTPAASNGPCVVSDDSDEMPF